MEQSLTVKVRLKPTNQQALEFERVSLAYRDACNRVSQWLFDQRFKPSRKDFNHDMYYDLKNQFPTLNTAMIQSTYRTVVARAY